MNSSVFCTVGHWLHTVSDNPSLLSTQILRILSTTCPSSPLLLSTQTFHRMLSTTTSLTFHRMLSTTTSLTFHRMLSTTTSLTPSLLQPKHFRAERCRDVPANSVFSSPTTSIFNAVHFDENSFPCQCQKEDKKA